MVRMVRYVALVLALWGGVSQIQAQSVWDVRNPVTQPTNLNAVTWAGGSVNLYAAVGATGSIWTSPDGTTWTVRTSGVTVTLYGITWTGTQFVAVGASGTILTSPTGVTWTSVGGTVTTSSLFGVAASPSRIVAVGQNGVLVTSTTGATWAATDISTLTTQSLNAVAWSTALSRFLAVGNLGAGLVSADGVSWTAANTTVTMYGVASVGAEFIAVGSTATIRAFDGTAWNSRAGGGSPTLYSVVNGDGAVAVGSAGAVRHSSDAITWNAMSSGTSQSLQSVAWSPTLTRFVAVGGNGTVLTSSNGQTWTQTSSSHAGLNALATRVVTTPSADTQLVAVGTGGVVMTSSNGTQWTLRSAGTASLYSVAAVGTNGATFVATGTNSAIRTSTDGITWTDRTASAPYGGAELYAVAGSNVATPTVVAVGSGSAVFVSTNGGTAWTSATGGTNGVLPTATPYGIGWVSSNIFVAVGDGGKAWRTTNPATGTWVESATGVTNRLNSITHTGAPLNLWVAVGEGGKIVTAADATTLNWAERVSGTATALKAVTSNGSVIVVTGSGGMVLTSSDGINWTQQVSGSASTLAGVRWDRRQYVAVGSAGAILTSNPAAVPLPPVLSAPAAGAINIPANPTFSWSAASGAVSYRVQVSSNSSFTDTLIDTTRTGATSITAGPLATGGTFHWRARTNGGSGSSAWTSSNAFTIRTVDSVAPFLLTPSNNAANVPLTTNVTWAVYPGATSYRVQVSTDSLFGSFLVHDSTVTNPTRLLNLTENSKLHFWRLSARLNSGVTAWSPVWRFTTTAPLPSPPALTSPADNAIGVTYPTATFSWSAASGAASYRLQLATNSDFSTIVRDTVVTGATSAAVSGLVLNGVYYWHVLSQNASGSSAYSATRTFTTATAPPAAPALVSPASGAIGVTPYTDLTWGTVANAVTYHVQLSISSAFNSTVINDSGLTVTTRTPPSLLANTTTYYWRVRAKNPAGAGAWSTVQAFTTGTAPIAPPAAPAGTPTPAPFSTVTTLSPTLGWNASATATKYRVQVSLQVNFTTLVVDDSTITGLTKVLSGLTGSTSYYWRVKAANQIGWGEWSETWLFNTPAVVPAAPVLLTPAQFATGVSVFPTLTWEASAGATSYRVQVSTGSGFATFLMNDSITTTSRALTGLAGNTDYYWRVNARNAAGTSAYSTINRFTTGAIPLPDVPVLVSPAQFDTGVLVNAATLTWQSSAGATAYKLQVSLASDFSTFFLNDTNVTTLTRTLGTLVKGTNYFWRVAAKNSAGSSAYSTARRFTTESPVAILPHSVVLRALSAGDGRALRFGLPRAERVSIRVHDTRGNLVVVLADGMLEAGYHTYVLPESLRGGLYLVEFRAGNYRATVKTQP